MRQFLKSLAIAVLVTAIAACGGGGGSAGSTSAGSASTTTGAGTATGVNTTATGSTQATTAGAITLQVLNSAAADTAAIGATEQARAVATVIDGTGAPVSGVVVVFAQSDASLVSFAPQSATALTDASGKAAIDLKATDPTKTGALSVSAAVVLSGTTLSAKKGLQINGTATVAEVPTSMLFLDASPSSIVIKGAGGSGRSESSTLRFKAVNASNSPVRGAVVNFTVSNANVTLNITQATTDAEGVAVTTVTSGSVPTSVVVTATAASNSAATVPSSSLAVSNGLTVAGGLEIVAAEYNIDGSLTGATTKVSAFMRDVNGNLVPDNTVVSFTTDFGAIGSSSAGSCLSVNGTCSVDFRVQEPRGTGVATVRATVQLPGQTVPLSDSKQISMSNSAGARALSSISPATVATVITLSGTCKDTLTLFAADPNNLALAARTTVAAQAPGKGVSVGIASGTPIEDSLQSFAPTSFRVSVDASTASPACNPLGGSTTSTTFELKFTSPNGITSTVPLAIQYPS